MLNQCVVSGNLGADPEIFYSSNGDPIASFNMAFKSNKKTSWIKVTAFKGLAELVEKHLHKGARIAVMGNLDQNQYKGKDGTARSNFQILARDIEFIKTDGRGFEGKEEEPF